MAHVGLAPLPLLMVLVGTAHAQVPPPLAQECWKARKTGVPMKTREAKLVLDPAPARFPPHSGALTRLVECGFQNGTLLGAREMWYLRLVSGDRLAPGFDPGFKNLGEEHFLVCEGALRTSLPAFVPGLSLSYAANTFTLPCTHHFYPAGSKNRADASRVTGVNGHAMRAATLTVLDGLAPGDDHFEVRVDVEVASRQETLRLRGRVAGELSGGLRVFKCDGGHPHSKIVQPDVCHGARPTAHRQPPVPPPPTKPASRLRYHRTCGEPVCQDGGYRGPFPGIPRCAGQAQGQACTTPGEQCDLGNDCNMLLVCTDKDPATRCAR